MDLTGTIEKLTKQRDQLNDAITALSRIAGGQQTKVTVPRKTKRVMPPWTEERRAKTMATRAANRAVKANGSTGEAPTSVQ
jgi:hypothetical protein